MPRWSMRWREATRPILNDTAPDLPICALIPSARSERIRVTLLLAVLGASGVVYLSMVVNPLPAVADSDPCLHSGKVPLQCPGADLVGARLVGANLHGAFLSQANLSHANLSHGAS